MTEIETLKGRQDELKGLRQENTQQLGAAIRRGKEAGIRYQSVVRAKLGPHNERLVQFNMSPIRRRPRKPLVVVVEKPPERGDPRNQSGYLGLPARQTRRLISINPRGACHQHAPLFKSSGTSSTREI